MTAQQKKNVETYRAYGISYNEIARKTGISVETIKSHCKRHGIKKLDTKPGEKYAFCKQCDAPMILSQSNKIFCSTNCRIKWWNRNKDQASTAANNIAFCEYCGGKFYKFKKSTQKYCSHKCYINQRFGLRKDADVQNTPPKKEAKAKPLLDIFLDSDTTNPKYAENEITYRLITMLLKSLVLDGLITQSESEVVRKKAVLQLEPIVGLLEVGDADEP